MYKPKTKVVKSKSSNVTIVTKKNNKKSRSNAEFQPLALKKRGVYVEKKATIISINEANISPIVQKERRNFSPPKKPPIPRPGKKRFLASVLTILSQSTTGTQYTDQVNPDKLKKFNRLKKKIIKRTEDDTIQEDSNSSPNSSKKKPKYRSRVLNANREELDQLVVLQSKKEIANTPSTYSDKSNIDYKEPESVKWTDNLPPVVNNINLENVNMLENKTKDIQENNKRKRVRLAETEPLTLVSEVPKKDETKLYNFFIDLLETTFNIYNVKSEFDPPPVSSVTSSKIALEMDESVARKLNIQKLRGMYDDDTQKQSSKYFYSIKPDENEHWNDKQLLEHFQRKLKPFKRLRTVSPTKLVQRKRRVQSELYDYKNSKPIPITNSLVIPNKRISLRKDRKKHFLNLLKDQLRMKADAFEEPQNFFQALKVIARNKRRCQKSLRFNNSTKKLSEGDIHECQFKRRKLLSASTERSSKKSSDYLGSHMNRSMSSSTRYSEIISSRFRRQPTITITETFENGIEPSQHSLQVYSFNYESNTNKQIPKEEKTGMSAYFTSASTSEQTFNGNEAALKNSDSGTNSIMGGHVAVKDGLRSFSKLL